MELIDRKNLKRDIIDCLTLEDWQCVLVNAIIDKQMVIDAVPVIHGHWIERFTGNEYVIECSNCKNESNEMADYHIEYDYCPYCGAKMYEKNGEHNV